MGFREFVSVSEPGINNMPTSEVTGYCIDVFNAALSKLPYAVPYKFYPLNVSSYDDMVCKVYQKVTI